MISVPESYLIRVWFRGALMSIKGIERDAGTAIFLFHSLRGCSRAPHARRSVHNMTNENEEIEFDSKTGWYFESLTFRPGHGLAADALFHDHNNRKLCLSSSVQWVTMIGKARRND